MVAIARLGSSDHRPDPGLLLRGRLLVPGEEGNRKTIRLSVVHCLACGQGRPARAAVGYVIESRLRDVGAWASDGRRPWGSLVLRRPDNA